MQANWRGGPAAGAMHGPHPHILKNIKIVHIVLNIVSKAYEL